MTHRLVIANTYGVQIYFRLPVIAIDFAAFDPLVIASDVAFAAVQEKASKRKRRGQKLFALQAKTTFGHRKSE